MVYLTMLVSVVFWIAAAVGFSRRRESLGLMDRMGRWFFAAAVVFTFAVWLMVPVSQADRIGDTQVSALFPRWFDAALEIWIPNGMLAVAASGAWGSTGAGLFMRFKLYTLLGFDWYYLAEVLPWALSAKAHAGNASGRQVTPYAVTLTDVWPLLIINLASFLLFLLLYAFISSVERHLRSHNLPARLSS